MIEVLLIIILVALFVNFSNSKARDRNIQDAIDKLDQRIKSIQNSGGISVEKAEKIVPKSEIEPPIVKPVATSEAVIPKIPSDISTEKDIVKEKTNALPPDLPIIEKQVPLQPIEVVERIEAKPVAAAYVAPKPFVPQKSWFETFKENNPDLEKFIGENLINKFGILILVLGISFFVKYAIDKEWINEPARVGIGVLCGGLVMAIAHKLKKNYAAFSSVLVAGAISILYFTIAIAFHEYHLFSQTVAFSIMTVITVFSVLVSVSYNRQELAVLSLIGGFAVPFMVSNGAGNYVVLFSYIAVLNTGILAIAYFKKWKIVTLLAFLFTTFLFAFWYTRELFANTLPHLGALAFATLFYFIFSITVVVSNIKNRGVFTPLEFLIMVANTFFFFAIGIGIIHNWGIDFKGLFTLSLALYNVIYAVIVYRKFGLDKNAIYLLIGLALTFLTLTIPLQFEGNQITLFWAAEAVLLLWLSQKSQIKHFKIGAVIVQILTIISLVMDWLKYEFPVTPLPIILNPLFISGLVVSISLLLTIWLLKKEKEFFKLGIFEIDTYKVLVTITLLIVVYLTGFLEINYQAYQYLANSASALSLVVSYHFVFFALLLFFVPRLKNETLTLIVLAFSTFSIVLYMLTFYGLPSKELVYNLATKTSSNFAFYLHYIILGCIIFYGYSLFKKAKQTPKIALLNGKWMPWLFVFATVYILSNEVMVHSLHFSTGAINMKNIDAEMIKIGEQDYDTTYIRENLILTQLHDIKIQIIKIGYPIVWGIFSFVFLIIGIKRQWKNLRIIALSLLGITIVKLFTYDIKDVSETGKIIAFILLGILILIISFVYQKLKKMVVEEVPNTNKDEEII